MPAPKKRPIMDVARPGKTAATATARPVIVGHGAMMKDPMVQKSATQAAAPETLSPTRGTKVVVPFTAEETASATQEAVVDTAVTDTDVKNTTATAAELTPVDAVPKDEQHDAQKESEPVAATATDDTQDAQDDSAEVDAAAAKSPEPVSPDNTEAAVVEAVVEQASIGKQKPASAAEADAAAAAIEKLIEEKTYAVPIAEHGTRRASKVVALVVSGVLLIVAGLYVLIDAGIIASNVKLPFSLMQSAKEQSDTVAVTTPTPTAVAPALTPYQDTTKGIGLLYPKTWKLTTSTDLNTSGADTIFITSPQITLSTTTTGAERQTVPAQLQIAITAQKSTDTVRAAATLTGLGMCSIDSITLTALPGTYYTAFTTPGNSGIKQVSSMALTQNICQPQAQKAQVNTALEFKDKTRVYTVVARYHKDNDPTAYIDAASVADFRSPDTYAQAIDVYKSLRNL